MKKIFKMIVIMILIFKEREKKSWKMMIF